MNLLNIFFFPCSHACREFMRYGIDHHDIYGMTNWSQFGWYFSHKIVYSEAVVGESCMSYCAFITKNETRQAWGPRQKR
ncbi:hypothetical protein ES703_63727 [subsurface metagenome]